MKQIKYYVLDASRYIMPHYMALSHLPNVLSEYESASRKAMKETGTAHAVYAVKHYTEDDQIDYVDFYCPPVCLNDTDFYERTRAETQEHPGCLIYAIHSHK